MNHVNTFTGSLSASLYVPASGAKPKQLVVLLHGLGADGDDLLGLAPILAQALPDAQFVAPNAPEACDMAPYGYQWFSLREWTYHTMLAGAEKAAPILNDFIDRQLLALGLNDENLALVGFSQGTMMALYTALRRPNCCAAVVGYSGMLLGVELLDAELQSRPPVCLIHGDQDMVVPYEMLEAAEHGLSAAGLSVESHTAHGLAHGIDERGIQTASAFLRRSFALV